MTHTPNAIYRMTLFYYPATLKECPGTEVKLTNFQQKKRTLGKIYLYY
jgi:hypothetical protein